ncbi:hypothetical protein BGZ83_004734 [Gryganskiella cystojenkinii]|nr:hypothetical protein BGZ83_004734 [Gryganskiella cystojenkinii]
MGNLLTKLCSHDIEDELPQEKQHANNSNDGDDQHNHNQGQKGNNEYPSSTLNQLSLKSSSDYKTLPINGSSDPTLQDQRQPSDIILLDSNSNNNNSNINNRDQLQEDPSTNLSTLHDTLTDLAAATSSALTTGSNSKDQSGNPTLKAQKSNNSLKPGFFKQISSSFTSLNKSNNNPHSDAVESKENAPAVPVIPDNTEQQLTGISSASKKTSSRFPGIRKTFSSFWSQKKREKHGIPGSFAEQRQHPKSLSLAQGLLREETIELSAEDRKLLLANEIPASEIEKLSIGVDAGGMGIIHVAEWKGIKVAIKEAQAQVISKEVEIYTRMIGYEGVVRFYGVTYPPGLNKLCIVTKYAENGSLSWHLKTGFNKLTWADKLSLATQIASSVGRLHEKGIFHRDLHGGNILIDEAGNAMLTDFGASTMEERVGWAVGEFAIKTMTTPEGTSKFVSERFPNMKKVLDESEASKSNPVDYSNSNSSDGRKDNKECNSESKGAATSLAAGQKHDFDNEDQAYEPLIGVMAYIAPERFRNPRYFDARCDIYSLGVLLWELTSGYGAFAKVSQDIQLAVSILNGKREDPVEGTPEKYQHLYEQCWDPIPDKRPSMTEILSTLAQVRAELSEEQLAVTRERNAYDGEESDFEESVSVPRPTSDYQQYLLPEEPTA